MKKEDAIKIVKEIDNYRMKYEQVFSQDKRSRECFLLRRKHTIRQFLITEFGLNIPNLVGCSRCNMMFEVLTERKKLTFSKDSLLFVKEHNHAFPDIINGKKFICLRCIGVHIPEAEITKESHEQQKK